MLLLFKSDYIRVLLYRDLSSLHFLLKPVCNKTPIKLTFLESELLYNNSGSSHSNFISGQKLLKQTVPQKQYILRVLILFIFRKFDNLDRRDISANFQDLAVERKAGNIDAKSRIKLDTISKAEYNSITTSICDLRSEISHELVKMNKKVTKMEELMSNFLKKLNDAFPDAPFTNNSTLLMDGIERKFATDNEKKVLFGACVEASLV